MALNLAASLMPDSMRMEAVDWRETYRRSTATCWPGLSAAVLALRERIRRADGVVIATPEYNFSIPACSRTCSTG